MDKRPRVLARLIINLLYYKLKYLLLDGVFIDKTNGLALCDVGAFIKPKTKQEQSQNL